MTVIITHQLDTVAINHLLNSTAGGVTRDMLRRGHRVEAAAKRKVKADHGRLRSSIHTSLTHYNGVQGVQVGSNLKYALWVHQGTGIYGPHGMVIRPTSKRVMVFTPRKFNAKGRRIKAGKVYIRMSRGQHANPYLKEALIAARGG